MECRARFVFFRITLPMLMPSVITATLFRLLDSIQQFDIIYSMTQGGPGDKLLESRSKPISISSSRQRGSFGGA
jgi:ABC-type sugar transport system permease subunit